MIESSITSGWQTIGHERVVSKLTNHILSGQLRHSYLFSGPPSIGKNTLANDFAKAICCIDNLGDPCGLCRPCKLISASKHPDVVEISPRVSGKPIVQKKLSERGDIFAVSNATSNDPITLKSLQRKG